MLLENCTALIEFCPKTSKAKLESNIRDKFEIIYNDGSLGFTECMGTNSAGVPISVNGKGYPNFVKYDGELKNLVDSKALNLRVSHTADYFAAYASFSGKLEFFHAKPKKTEPIMYKDPVAVWYIDNGRVIRSCIIGEDDQGLPILDNLGYAHHFMYCMPGDLLNKLLLLGSANVKSLSK